MLEKAIQIAVSAHAGQKDKAGRPYILHPFAVMARMKTENERIVAVLHDVVEDTDVTLQDLSREGFSANILQAIDCLTRRRGETYEEFILRAKSTDLSRNVKLADLAENMDLTRLPEITAKDLTRQYRYKRAVDELKAIH